MKELLFGWLTKPKYMITGLDEFIALIEIEIVFVVGFFIVLFIKDWWENK